MEKEQDWVWEGMDKPGPYKDIDEEQAQEDLESWIKEKALEVGRGRLPSEALDIYYDPDYSRVQVREVGGRPELHIGTKDLRPYHLYQEGFREGISHELAHLALGHGVGDREIDIYTLIKEELSADLLGRKGISPKALANLTEGVSRLYSLSIPDSWEYVSEVAKTFRLSTQTLNRAKSILGLRY